MQILLALRTLLEQKGYSNKSIKEIWKWYDFSEKSIIFLHPKYGKEIQDIEAAYSPYLGDGRLGKEIQSTKTSFPIAGGILAIVAACISVFLGIISIASFVSSLGYPWYSPDYWTLFIGVTGFFAFAFGLTGGIMSLKRKNRAVTMVGVCLTMLSGFITIPAFGTMFLTGLLFGIPIILFSVPSLIIIAISKTEFS